MRKINQKLCQRWRGNTKIIILIKLIKKNLSCPKTRRRKYKVKDETSYYGSDQCISNGGTTVIQLLTCFKVHKLQCKIGQVYRTHGTSLKNLFHHNNIIDSAVVFGPNIIRKTLQH